jgi:hypothetical protein
MATAKVIQPSRRLNRNFCRDLGYLRADQSVPSRTPQRSPLKLVQRPICLPTFRGVRLKGAVGKPREARRGEFRWLDADLHATNRQTIRTFFLINHFVIALGDNWAFQVGEHGKCGSPMESMRISCGCE